MKKNLWASIDLGTNSCLLLLCEEQPDGTLREISEECQIVRLGESLAQAGRLSDAAIHRTFDALDHHLARIPRDATGGLGIVAATSAVRDAENGRSFLKAIADRVGGGRSPVLFTGDEEALTIFLGAASEARADQFVVTIDVGGGSTEIAAGFRDDCRLVESLDVGCVRSGEAYDLLDVGTWENIDALRCEVRKCVTPVAEAVRRLDADNPPVALASAGTATTLAAYMQKIVEYDRDKIHGFQADMKMLDQAIADLAFLDTEQRAQIPGIQSGRAPVLPAGLVILEETLKCLDIQAFTVTTRALRYGMLLRLRRGDLEPTFRW